MSSGAFPSCWAWQSFLDMLQNIYIKKNLELENRLSMNGMVTTLKRTVFLFVIPTDLEQAPFSLPLPRVSVTTFLVTCLHNPTDPAHYILDHEDWGSMFIWNSKTVRCRWCRRMQSAKISIWYCHKCRMYFVDTLLQDSGIHKTHL